MGRRVNKFGPTRLGRGVKRPWPRCRWAEMSVYHADELTGRVAHRTLYEPYQGGKRKKSLHGTGWSGVQAIPNLAKS